MNLVIAPGAWSGHVERMLRAAMRADPGASVHELYELVGQGAATLLEVRTEAGEVVGAVVLRVDERRRECGKFSAFRDGVIVAAGASARWVWRCMPALLADLERRFQGVQRIRIHTASRGLVRALRRQGYQPQEVVLWKSATA